MPSVHRATPPSAAAAGSPANAGEQQFRLLVEGVTDYAIFLLDPAGIVTTWNPGAERIKGYTRAEIVGRHFSTFYTEEARARGEPAEVLDRARRHGREEREGWRVRKDGTRFWANVVVDAIRDAQGQLVGFAKVTRDLTERRAAEQALRESEERFRLLVQGVTDYAIFMLDPQGRITNWNAGGERIKGYAADEIVGRHLSTFYTEEDAKAGLPQRGLDTAAREGRFESEGWRVRKDGTRFWASVVIDAIRADDGRLLGFAKVTRDITERRNAAERLAKAQAVLAQAQKMEAVGQLTGGLAHDFNNLLTVVLNNLDILGGIVGEAGGDATKQRARRLIENAFRAAERGSKLTQQLLAFSRRQTLRPTVQSPVRLIREFEAILRRAAGDAVEMAFELAAGTTAFQVDATQFESALLNLVVNARDAMPAGGRLVVACRTVTLDEAAAQPLDLAPGRYVAASVADNGTGMSDDVRTHAIEPFFTTKEIGKGTGLGLAQVYGFVTQSGGQLDIESAAGRGTTVTLYLPAAEGEAARAEEAATAAVARGSGTVLVVEDDPELRETTVEMLRDVGCSVFTAADAPAALEVLRREPGIDILFSDVVLPKGVSGVALAEAVQALRPEMRIILASGYPNPGLAQGGGALHKFAFIAKPYRWTDMAEKIRAAMAERRRQPG